MGWRGLSWGGGRLEEGVTLELRLREGPVWGRSGELQEPCWWGEGNLSGVGCFRQAKVTLSVGPEGLCGLCLGQGMGVGG